MSETVNIHEVKTHLSRLLESVAAGREVIIAKAGLPVAKLIPFTQEGRKPGLARGRGRLTKAFFEPLAEEDLVG